MRPFLHFSRATEFDPAIHWETVLFINHKMICLLESGIDGNSLLSSFIIYGNTSQEANAATLPSNSFLCFAAIQVWLCWDYLFYHWNWCWDQNNQLKSHCTPDMKTTSYWLHLLCCCTFYFPGSHLCWATVDQIHGNRAFLLSCWLVLQYFALRWLVSFTNRMSVTRESSAPPKVPATSGHPV